MTMANPRIAVVTGGNKGVGYAIVQGLCEKFDGIVYLTARDAQRGKAAVDKLKKLSLKPEFHQLDITDAGSITEFAAFIKKKHGGLDVLVNNAAVAFFVNSSVPLAQQAKDAIDANYTGLVNMCKALFPLLRPHARVVNVSSTLGHLLTIPSKEIRDQLSSPSLTEEKLTAMMNEFVESARRGDQVAVWGDSAYSVSKVGVSALTMIQQREFDKDPRKDIVVNSCHPGYVATDLNDHSGDLTIEEGAYAPLKLALLPPGVKTPRGEYVWRDGKVVSWVEPLKEPY